MEFSRLPIALKSFIFSMAIETPLDKFAGRPFKLPARHPNHHSAWQATP